MDKVSTKLFECLHFIWRPSLEQVSGLRRTRRNGFIPSSPPTGNVSRGQVVQLHPYLICSHFGAFGPLCSTQETQNAAAAPCVSPAYFQSAQMRLSKRKAPEMSIAPGRTLAKKERKDRTLKCFRRSQLQIVLIVCAANYMKAVAKTFVLDTRCSLHQTSGVLEIVALDGWKVYCRETSTSFALHCSNTVELVQAAKLHILIIWTILPATKPRISFLFCSVIFPTINSTCFVDFHLNTDAFLNFEWGS